MGPPPEIIYGLLFNYKNNYNGIVVSVCVFSMVKPVQCLLNIVIIEHLYSAPSGIYSEALSALAYDVKYRYERIFSVSSQDSKFKESPEADPRKLVEPTNRFPSTSDRR